MSRVTQTAIARHLGVSRSAVAAVLGNSPSSRISPELKERILSAAEELGYVPNRFAQIMSKGRSGMIGVINFGWHEPLSQAKVAQLVEGIIKAGYEPVVDNARWFSDQGKAVCTRMIQMQMEGVILVHPPLAFTQTFLDLLLSAQIPVVSLGGTLKGITRFLSDKERGFHMLTRHLLDTGYRRLMLVVGSDISSKRKGVIPWHAANAREGFLKAIAEQPSSDPAIGEAKVVSYRTDPLKTGAFSAGYERGYENMKEILKGPKPPEAILCSNDSWAIGALSACSEAHIRVPENLALTGFEDDPVSRYGLLPLTTVSHPIQSMVEQGVEILLKAIRTGEPTPDEIHILPGKLVIRESCGAKLRELFRSPQNMKQKSANLKIVL